MIDAIFAACLQQALMLSLAVALLRAVRPLLLRQGAGLTYAAWWLVPAFLLTPILPRPHAEPLQIALTSMFSASTDSLAALPTPPTTSSATWLALWVGGALVMLAVQGWRQLRLVGLGEELPAGSSPALVGLWSPRVALPVDFEQRFKPEERELILAHEAVHRQRLDNLWNLLAALLHALHWWNPLAWWAVRRLQADQELACDAAVLALRPNSGPTYARALLAAHNLDPQVAPVASRWSSAHPIVERIAMLKRPLHPSRRAVAVMTCALSACAGIAWAGQAATPADTSGPNLKLKLLVAQQVGERVNRLSLALAGRQGEAMRLENPGDGSDGNPPLALELTARLIDPGKVQIDTVIWEGRPLAVTARPRLVLKLDEPGMVENIEPGTNRRFSLVIVPSMAQRP